LPAINVPELLISFAVLIFSLTVHETAHAWTASRFGDDTARRLGRVSLNPLVHIDPIGTLLLPLIAMVSHVPILGWAKPTPVNQGNLRHPRRDGILVTAAGPASNLCIAVLASFALRAIPAPSGLEDSVDVSSPLIMIATLALDLNLLLALFNMIPVPPLDGGRVVAGLLPPRLAVRYNSLGQYGFLIIYALILTGALWSVIGPPYDALRSWLR
jgi:Zn-dependent protease